MSEPTEPKPLHIVELHIDNVKRLTAAHIIPRAVQGKDHNTVVLGGRNKQGKSSVLDAIEMALTGKICKRPIHDGADHAQVIAHLGELIVKRTFTKGGGGTLTVSQARPDGTPGAKLSSPQTVLNELYGTIAFDPLEFSRQKPEKQLETLREMCGINTTMIDAARQKAFDERTGVNRKVKELEAFIAKAPFHKDVPEEAVNATALDAQLKEQREANEHRAKVILRGKQEVESLELLSKQIAEKEAELVAMKQEYDERTIALENLRTEAHALPSYDNTELLKQIDNIALTNQKIAENTTRSDAEEALAKHRATSEELTKKIDTLIARKRQKLEEANYPVKGLKLTDDGIEFEGQPWEQASAAEQMRVSVAIAIAANPRLRVMLVRDAALLDDESLGLLEKMAEETNTQVWIERVGYGDECHVIIEDGRIAEE